MLGQRLGQRAQQHVNDALRGLNISAGHGCRWTRIDDGTLGRDQLDRAHQSGGRGNVFAQQAAEDVEAGGIRDGFHGVDAALHLRRAAGEIDDDGSRLAARSFCCARKGDAHRNAHGRVADAIVVEHVLGGVASRGRGRQKCAHHFLGVIQQRSRGTLHARDAVTRAQFEQPRAAGVARRQLRAEVAFALLGSANIVQQHGEQVAVEFAAAHDLHRRNAQPFLVNLATGAHRAGVGAANIGVMRARGDEEICGERRRWRRVARRPTNTGATTVMSGRCVPPRKGSLSIATSPGASRNSAMAARTDIGIEPRCTGM